jgi:nicotinate (nicotinamide) nucleotide adenylyltransferase
MSYYDGVKNIILFGGSFDPIHMGHISVAKKAIAISENPKADELWFLLCNSNSFGRKHLSSEEHRRTMIALSIIEEHLDNMKVYSIESDMGNNAGVYAVVKKLIQAYPLYNFTYLIGSDQASKIRKWRNSRKLINLLRFIVIKRLSNNAEQIYVPSWIRRKPHIYIKNPPTFLTSSSSTIRGHFLVSREIIRNVHYPRVCRSVKEYILRNDLYN